jgi:hypothetical protein
METIKKTNKLSENLRKAYLKDINSICCILCNEFNIYNKQHNEQVDSNNLYKFILTQFDIQNQICCAITMSNTRCTRKCISESKYCKLHVSKQLLSKQQVQPTIDILYISQQQSTNTTLEKQFIDDSFYYVDNKYIYDENYVKAGIININELGKKDFILTDDPFILQQ